MFYKILYLVFARTCLSSGMFERLVNDVNFNESLNRKRQVSSLNCGSTPDLLETRFYQRFTFIITFAVVTMLLFMGKTTFLSCKRY